MNNITRAINSVNSTVRAISTLRSQFRSIQNPRPTPVRPSPRPSSFGSLPQPQAKPLGLSQIASQPTSGRNINKKPVRPASRTDIGPKIR